MSQPDNSLISLALASSVGFNISITLHAAIQAIRLRRSGTSLITYTMRVTLWTTTAFHLDTPILRHDPNASTPLVDYHQDYYKKNSIRYKIYRCGCGRDQRLEELWGSAKE
jgi:hypothetical protein